MYLTSCILNHVVARRRRATQSYKMQVARCETKRGQAVISTVLFFLVSSLTVLFGAASPVVREVTVARDAVLAREAYYRSEGAVEETIYRIKKGYTVASGNVQVGSSSVPVTVVETAGQKIVTALGDSLGDQRRVQATAIANVGVAFNYGIHVGTTGVSMSNNSIVNGNIFTNGSLTGGANSRINGSAFAVGTISTPNPVVTGTKQTGVTAIPLPEVDVPYWKEAANVNNDPHTGNLNFSGTGNTLGPKKVIGNVTLTNNAVLTVTGPLHITGTLTVSNGGVLKLDNSFGSVGTAVVVDGTIYLQNNSYVRGTTANPKGYLLLVGTHTGTAIFLENNGAAETYLYAPSGTVELSNNATAFAIVGKGVTLSNNAVVNYNIGLAHPQFTTGPGGAFDIKNWRETE